MAELRKADFRSVDICRLMKNHSCKKSSRRKPFAREVLRRRNVEHIIEFPLNYRK